MDKGEGLSQCKHFVDKRVNFFAFYADVFYERPQSMARHNTVIPDSIM